MSLRVPSVELHLLPDGGLHGSASEIATANHDGRRSLITRGNWAGNKFEFILAYNVTKYVYRCRGWVLT